MNFIMIYHFYLKEWRLKKSNKLVTKLHDKTEYVIHKSLNHRLAFKKVKFIECLNLIQTLGFKTIYWYERRSKKKKQKMLLKKIFLSWWIMQFLEKLWKMLNDIEILNFSQQKEEETI